MRSKLFWAAIAAAWFSLYPLAAEFRGHQRPRTDPQRKPAGERLLGDERPGEEPKEPEKSPAPGSEPGRDGDGNPGRGRSGRLRRRDVDVRLKSHATVKAAFRQAVLPAKAATVRIRIDGKAAALGAIVEPDGYIISKASLLDGQLTCRMPDGRELPARLLGQSEETDLALLKVEADDLKTVSWRPGGAPPVGSWVATVGQQDDPLAIGVVSAEPRTVPGSRRIPSRRGVLGVSLEQAGAGPRIHEVIESSAAEAAGLKVGDLVRRIDGRPLRTVQQMVETVGSHPPGKKITLLIERDKAELRLTAALGKPQPESSRRLAPEDHWGGGPFSERRRGFPSAMPHDTALRPADCGGPLVDTEGNVVGINIARALRVISYAIPAGVARKVLAELKNKAR